MFAKLAVFTTAVFSVLVVATPLPHGDDSYCSTGPVQCCQSLTSNKDASQHAGMYGLLGIDFSDLDAYVGAQCSPVDAIALKSGNACASKAVCCQSNAYGGLINVGCVPIMF